MPAENFYCLDNFFKKMTDLDSPKKNNDCYFYYYSTCAKGDNCTFRHEPSALGCETMCSFWKEGKCVNVHCNFRHMELRKNRKAIPCYWESQPMGCLKAHCPFLHQSPRPSELNRSNLSSDQAADLNSSIERKVTAVDSLVVSFEEESDTESSYVFSPAKNVDRIVTVKSLEEIRLEKIQAESAKYYEYNVTSPTYDEFESNRADVLRERIVSRIMNKSMPDRMVTAPSKRLSDSQFTSTLEKKRKLVYRNEDVNFEIKLNKLPEKYYHHKQDIRAVSDLELDKQYAVTFTGNSEHRQISLGKPSSNNTPISTIKIKTLEEIRRERKAKVQEDEQEVTSTSMDIDIKTSQECQPIQKKRKIVLRRHDPSSSTPQENKSDSFTSDISNVQRDIETESNVSKLEDDVYLLEGDDDFDSESVTLKLEEELLNEVDDCLNE